jgi:hypothetical protein
VISEFWITCCSKKNLVDYDCILFLVMSMTEPVCSFNTSTIHLLLVKIDMSASANQKAIFSKILVAIDSSDASMDAADYAISISQRYNAEHKLNLESNCAKLGVGANINIIIIEGFEYVMM